TGLRAGDVPDGAQLGGGVLSRRAHDRRRRQRPRPHQAAGLASRRTRRSQRPRIQRPLLMTPATLRPAPARLNWPLMRNNISRADLDAVIELLRQDDPILTQSSEVRAFEREWSDWLGVRHSVFVNSGSSANLLTMAALRECYGEGEVIVPALAWVSDIASVIHNRLEPVFVDIDPRTLGMDNEEVLDKLTPRTRAVFLTHVMGYNALGEQLLNELKARNI